MNEQNGATPYAADGEGEALYANPSALLELSQLNRTNPHAASVMLTLMSIIGGNGAVRTTQAIVAKHCNYTLQQVEKAVAELAEGKWILSVDASPEPGGSLVCTVNSNVARSEKPEELV
ncbi:MULTISPECIES: hypothetical protein [unclassified Pseudomonas]|uniref:MarR family transcriptional regulator n=1 Tax=Pseudomonas sp. MYb327 TaxID=2745230 RepID=A0AAU8DVI9_9PSED